MALVLIGLVAMAAPLEGSVPGGDEAEIGDPLQLTVSLEAVVDGLEGALLLVGAGDGSGDRYIVEKRGRVLRLGGDGTIDPEPLLDISGRVLAHNERGLLGLAFHPRFEENGRFFVAYSRRDDGATSISEFTATPEEQKPIEQRERPLLVIPQPYTTHKGGMLAFDEGGMLLIGSGDGGGAWDPHHHAQDPTSLLGKLLRIDVDHGWPYAIPPDNGFADQPGARGEVHAIGLRNPWRFSVDRVSGAVYIGDVGQDSWEEIDVLQRDERGTSFGWSDLDGEICRVREGCDGSAHRPPAIAYQHVDSDIGHCAVIGGYAYRGAAGSLPAGTYLYADYCSGTIWAIPADELVAGGADPVVVGQLDPSYGLAQGFGQDDAGELYLLTSTGNVLHISAAKAD